MAKMPAPSVSARSRSVFKARHLIAACAMVSVLFPIGAVAEPSNPPTLVAATSSTSAYQLGPGDKLHLITFGEDTLTGDFYVSDAGDVSLPLVGNVHAAGLSVTEFQQHVQAALADGYMKDPRVSVQVETYRPFYILGEVNKPGEYPYEAGLTVLSAVATASGFTYRANTHRVYIKSNRDTKERPTTVTATTEIMPGDTIRVGERYF
jgi:polysaccharide export outer membrane protein